MLTPEEELFYNHFKKLKQDAGTHSPSIFKLLHDFPDVKIKVDACFLCNPYAFNLFYERLKDKDLEKYIKFYPPQNHEVAENIAEFRGLPKERILIGNGAIEIIETIMADIYGSRIIYPLPTFSAYYENLSDGGKNYPMPYYLKEENDFVLNVEDFIKFSANMAEYVILVNPNNPTGTFITYEDLVHIHQSLESWQTLIVDESFIDFAPAGNSIEQYAIENENLIVIRSLSKDFGIAGLRLGYAILPEEKVGKYLQEKFLWNSNGIAYFFTELLADKSFQKKYLKAKNDYNNARDDFFQELVNMGIDVIPSYANFFMIKTPGDPEIYFTKLLYSHGIYTRLLDDKQGLDKGYIRVASKDRRENRQILHAIGKIWNDK
jgi:threonine-phosphate decarboxylase